MKNNLNQHAILLLAWLRRAIPPLLVVAALLTAWFELQDFDIHALQETIRKLPVWTLLGLQVLALAAVFSMVLYDWWVGRWLKLNLPLGRKYDE